MTPNAMAPLRSTGVLLFPDPATHKYDVLLFPGTMKFGSLNADCHLNASKGSDATFFNWGFDDPMRSGPSSRREYVVPVRQNRFDECAHEWKNVGPLCRRGMIRPSTRLYFRFLLLREFWRLVHEFLRGLQFRALEGLPPPRRRRSYPPLLLLLLLFRQYFPVPNAVDIA